MINTFVQVTKDPEPGPMLIGSFAGSGNWRIEFQPDSNVLMNCSILHPNGHTYTMAFRNNRAVVTVDSTPKPIVLSLKGNDSLVGTGPIQVEGLPGVAAGTYYLMISSRYNNQNLVWGQPVQLKDAPNSVTLDQHNAVPLN